MLFLCCVSKYIKLKVNPCWLFYMLFFRLVVAYIIICHPIWNTDNPDLENYGSIFLDQADPIQCYFEKWHTDYLILESKKMGFFNLGHFDADYIFRTTGPWSFSLNHYSIFLWSNDVLPLLTPSYIKEDNGKADDNKIGFYSYEFLSAFNFNLLCLLNAVCLCHCSSASN